MSTGKGQLQYMDKGEIKNRFHLSGKSRNPLKLLDFLKYKETRRHMHDRKRILGNH